MTPMQNKLYKAAVDKMRHEVALATTTAEASALHSGRGRGRGRGRKGLPPTVSTNGDPNALVAKLGSQRVNNIFTHLRKVANHPLLIRSVFDDTKASGGCCALSVSPSLPQEKAVTLPFVRLILYSGDEDGRDRLVPWVVWGELHVRSCVQGAARVLGPSAAPVCK